MKFLTFVTLLAGAHAYRNLQTYTLPSGETVYEHMPTKVPGQEIPQDCQVWQSGCTSCGVNGGKTGMCSMVLCQYTKCLPHCSNYQDKTKVPDNCTKWHDGCNHCELTRKEEMIGGFKNVRYVLDENSKCSMFMCSPIAWGKPQCLEYQDCMVDIDESTQIEQIKEMKSPNFLL